MTGPSRRTAIWTLLLLGGATLAAAAPTWISTTGSTVLEPVVDVAVSGTTAAPGVGAAALVLVAAALALGLVGRVGRWVVLAVAAVSGVVVVATALGVVLDPVPAARSAVAEATNVTEPTSEVVVSAAPWVAVTLGVATVLVALWAAAGSRAWAGASTRHERPTNRAPAPETTDHDTWDALTRGADPTDTDDPNDTDGTAAPAGR
ncbi:Trp biosynthesis-associated membrane protein [Cellulosimicrobium arenosum]|uniref:Trp biosynthesis-associated membrane protein n=1 Tax=Cellulosimicrobium arenosum TaxID=2708133 RepID=A0A927G679_9MICO|nr:Trp biosynthesis-associated membrane protein [Cellulosimicrobium arenosum]MBD8077668.1 Trp biosynthesis-associated membrane protein [Cellulosimicrobium arenosum]